MPCWTLVLWTACRPAVLDDADSAVESRADTGRLVDSRPNVLLIIADDFGVDLARFDASDPCYNVGPADGSDPVLPNLAALCQAGVRFQAAWSQPTCSPTRSTMLTGRMPYVTGVGGALKEDGVGSIPLTEQGLPQVLDVASANIGKWHLSIGPDDPNTLGWDHYSGSLHGVLPSYTAWARTEDGIAHQETAYATSWTVDHGIEWVDANADEPWLLWLAFNAPHTPLHVPPTDLHDRDLVPYTIDEPAAPYVAAMSEAMDHELGRLFDHLHASGEWDDTIVVFVGDNGTERGVSDGPFELGRQKGTVAVGGVWVPVVIAGPGIEPGVSDELVGLEDLFPTIVEWLDGSPDPDVPIGGASLVPLLSGEQRTKDYLTAHLFDTDQVVTGEHAIRDDRFGLVCIGAQHEQFFDLSVDPYQLDDLSAADPYPAERTRLRGELEARVGQAVCPAP